MSKRLQLIKSHFKKADPKIYQLIIRCDFELLPKPKNSRNYFFKLCREIIAQQLASGAANAIIGRFLNLFPKKRVTPDKILVFTEKDLRGVGMSWAKARYIRDLAEKIKNRQVNLKSLHNLQDEVVIEELIKVKGIGKWTAEMFLIFTLGRENIFSHGDLGLNRAIQKLYGFKERPNEQQVSKIIASWSPYKSYGCLMLWRSLKKN